MGKQVLISHAVYHINKSVGLAVQIRLVNLLDVTREYHLRPLSGTCYDGFYFMRSKVLRLVNDAISLAQAASTDKGQASITSWSLFCISSNLFTSLELDATDV